jgi:hypothetical protein
MPGPYVPTSSARLKMDGVFSVVVKHWGHMRAIGDEGKWGGGTWILIPD